MQIDISVSDTFISGELIKFVHSSFCKRFYDAPACDGEKAFDAVLTY